MLRAITFLLSCGLACAAFAQDASERERADFKRLYAEAAAGSATEADFVALADYPLYPYLLAARLAYQIKHRPATDTDHKLADFLARYPELGITPALQARWLRSLAKRENWHWLLAYIPPDTQNVTLRCQRVQAKIELGVAHGRLDEALDLWRHGQSRPRACDPVFEWLKTSDRLTPALVEKRIQLAQTLGEVQLVQALVRLQDGQARDRTERWLALYRNPKPELERLGEQRDPAFAPKVVLGALQKLARRDLEAAAGLQPRLAHRGALPAAEAAEAAAYIGYRYSLSREPEAQAWFERAGTASLDEKLRDWRVRTALLARDWAAVRAWIDLLPQAERTQERWRYWYARALLELMEPAGQAKARALLAELAQTRSYYGYLAADRLGLTYALNHQAAVPDPAEQARLVQSTFAQRARELWLVDLQPQARAEWQQFVRRLRPAEQRQAALLAHRWGWHSRAILTLQSAGEWNDLEVRFPLPYRGQIESLARAQDLDPAWVYGLMRTESLFITDARSSSNAYGLMQLLPSTGQRTARKLGLAWHGIATLEQPQTNIHLGTAYLKEMLDKFGGGAALATAAYNAGPRPVARWLPHTPTEGALWVEIIPYNETHKYVKTVLEYATTFEWRLSGKTTRLSRRLGTIPPADQLPVEP